MSAQKHRPAKAAVELRLRVPRGALGDVEQGVRDVLERIDGVERAEIRDLLGVHPRSLDLYVETAAALELAFENVDDPDAVAARLRDGFGVERVETVLLDAEP